MTYGWKCQEDLIYKLVDMFHNIIYLFSAPKSLQSFVIIKNDFSFIVYLALLIC